MSAAESDVAGRTGSVSEESAGLAGRLANLPLDKRARLERLLIERRQGAPEGADAIPRRSGRGPWPLSYAQELMWLLDQLAPGGNAYNSPAASRLEGPLDVDALRRALDAVVARNEVLRTTYDAVDGRPVQVVHPPAPVELGLVDLSALPPPARSAELDRVLKDEAERPFDLRGDPVLRPTLVRLSAEDHVLLLVMHHIAIDGWSKGVMWRELTSCYDALAAGRPVDLPELPLQYADWAKWHRSWLDGGVLEEQLGYWRRRLAGAPALLELPTDRPRPPVRTARGDRRDTMFAAETLSGLRQLAREENATLFMVVLAAFGTLLGRYSGSEEIVVGTPIAGRNRVEIEELIGYFMNTVALRLDLRGDPSFREVVRRARATTVGAFAHQDVPFERVVAEVNPTRDLSRTPVFQVMLVLQNQRRDEFGPAGLHAAPVRHERGWAKFDLTVGLGERPQGLNSSWEYSTDLFDAPTVERMMRAFGVLLDAVVADADVRISDLPLLPEDDLRRLAEWEEGGPALGVGRCLPDLVAERAELTPTAPAVDDGAVQLTYAELLRAADRLAGQLQTLGVGTETPVAVCADRSARLLVALLAVLRAGGSCVPLDPAYPLERLRVMVGAAGAAVVLCDRQYADRFRDAGRVIVLDDSLTEPTAAPAEPLRSSIRPDSAAYVLYTSGSTGSPRGVVLEHAGLVNHALAAGRRYRLEPHDRVLQFASPGFDISIEEIFATLAAGACIVPRPPGLPLGGIELVEWLDHQGITVLDLPTAYWHEWVGDLTARGLALPSSLRLVVVGGEKASPAAYAAWRRLAGDRVAWVNTYGPTEASVVVTAFEPPADGSVDDGAELPIGRPLPGVRVEVLDGRDRRVPVGVRGELHVGGPSVARGYLNDVQGDARRFQPDPHEPGRRRFATGDLVRWRADGNLAYAGRTDTQVKLRGFRIEPGGVEAALAASGMVDESLVLVRGAPGSERLVAYAVSRQGPPDRRLGEDLRAFLSQRLPSYLLPDTVVVLPSLPRTANDKVDLEALPVAPVPDDRASEAEPHDDVERRLLEIWRSLLGMDAIGVRDNFFELGGHSLLAVRLLASVEQALGTRLPLATLVTAPTIAELAEVVRRERPAPSWDCLVPLQPGGSRTPLFLVHGIRGQLLLYGALVRRLGADQPVYGLQSVGLDRRTAPLTSISAMAARYVAEVRSVQPHGPYLLGGFCFGGVVALEMASQLRRQDEDVHLVALLHARPYGEEYGSREHLGDRARRRVGEFRATSSADRLRMIPETAGRILQRGMRSHRARTVRRYLKRGSVLPSRLHDIELVNRISVAGYSTPEHAGRAVLFLADNGVRDVERKLGMWTTLAPDLDVRRIWAPGPAAGAMLAEPYVADLAEKLRHELDAAAAKTR